MEKILLVDDDPVTCEIIKSFLEFEDFSVHISNTGHQAIRSIAETSFDLVLLDIMLPDIDGNAVAQTIRQSSDIPIVFISCRSSDVDKAIGLGIGGDDYVTKPISRIELIARIKAHLRRYRNVKAVKTVVQVLHCGSIRMDIPQRRVWIDDKEVILTALEFNLLKLFMENQGQVLTKDQIFYKVWGDDFFDDNTLMVAIRRLRFKIEKNPAKPTLLQTVWGMGYRLKATS